MLPRAMRGAVRVVVCAVVGVCLALALSGPAFASVSSTKITFYFGLRRPEAAAQRAFYTVQDPTSPEYRRFMSLRRISQLYGAPSAIRSAFVRDVRRLGLSARIDPSGVFARVTGTVSKLDQVFDVKIKREFVQDPNALLYSPGDRKTLKLPEPLRPLVREVSAFYEHSASAPPGRGSALRQDTRRPLQQPPTAKGPKNHGTWTRGCTAARKTGAYSYGQIRHAYGVQSLGAGGRASLAILNAGEDVTSKDIATGARCFGYPKAHVRILRTDGQTTPFGPGQGEPQLDLAIARGMAPGMRSLTFTKAWADPGVLFLGANQVLTERRRPDVLTISYGWCDRLVQGPGAIPRWRAGAGLMDAILVRLGLAGVSTFASSGDQGSTCAGQPYLGASWPGSSPFLTSVGGTRLVLDHANQRADEVVWNDLRWWPQGGASGGGLVAAVIRPPYQRGVNVDGDRRAVPDLSAVASNFPGWPSVMGGTWLVVGGTSAATPAVASEFALIDARLGTRRQSPLGPVNGLLYYLHQADPSSFYDVTSGNNRYSRKVPGYPAHRGYDLATGLGVPEPAQIAREVPPAGGLTQPGS
jgi:subtilase family serine protease